MRDYALPVNYSEFLVLIIKQNFKLSQILTFNIPG